MCAKPYTAPRRRHPTQQSKEGNQDLSKEGEKASWDRLLASMPTEYTFRLDSGNMAFPKGSQVFLCYGRITNRELLKRYGFCI